MFVVDTSVAIAALVLDHPSHVVARTAVDVHRPVIAGHALVETFSVLTRLPGAARLPGAEVLELLDLTFPEVVWPTSDGLDAFLSRFAARRVSGGAVYDALVALAAATRGTPLVTLDRRATATYRSFGVEALHPNDLP